MLLRVEECADQTAEQSQQKIKNDRVDYGASDDQHPSTPDVIAPGQGNQNGGQPREGAMIDQRIE